MFKGLKKNGEDTPLDHIPDMDDNHIWFVDAYKTLSYSSDENGRIPLSELAVFDKHFGLIGTFKEFANIIYAISDSYIKFNNKNN